MFKDYVADDIKKTFFNADEFAEPVCINGVEVAVVEDNERLEYRIKENYGGMVIGDILFFINESEYGKIPRMKNPPVANQAVEYNERACTVTDVKKESGVYEIVLQYAGW